MSPVTKILQLTLAMTLLSPATHAADETDYPRSIDIFTTSEFKIDRQDIDATIFEIDGLAVLDDELSAGLPADPDGAKQLALQRISELGNALRSKAEQAAEGLSLAHRYDIKKIPAMVFDGGQSVIYGLTDLDQAIDIYRQGATP